MMNEMKDRLVELIYEARKEWDFYFNDCLLKGKPRSKTLDEFIADHLIENGVVVPPCKVGDSCYPLPRYRTPIAERKVSRITFSQRNIIIGYYENDGQYRPPLRTRTLGEDVFLTKSEAEQKLKEMRDGNDL